jgi:hypothetical protein
MYCILLRRNMEIHRGNLVHLFSAGPGTLLRGLNSAVLILYLLVSVSWLLCFVDAFTFKIQVHANKNTITSIWNG